jgi:hypothetical protein
MLRRPWLLLRSTSRDFLKRNDLNPFARVMGRLVVINLQWEVRSGAEGQN